MLSIRPDEHLPSANGIETKTKHIIYNHGRMQSNQISYNQSGKLL